MGYIKNLHFQDIDLKCPDKQIEHLQKLHREGRLSEELFNIGVFILHQKKQDYERFKAGIYDNKN